MSICKKCREKENVVGYWFCVDCLEHKKNFCKCGEPKSPTRDYCKACSYTKTKESRLRMGRVVNGVRKGDKNRSKIDKIMKELFLFVDYITEKSCIDFYDINDLIDLYQKLDEVDLIDGHRNSKESFNMGEMWKVIKKIYEIEKYDFL